MGRKEKDALAKDGASESISFEELIRILKGKQHVKSEFLPKEMTDTSYIFFPKAVEDKRFCFLDDPAMEIKALDPNFRIRRNIHFGRVEKTGYGLQVLIDNTSQEMKMLAYLRIRGHTTVLSTSGGYAIVFDLKRMKGINCTSNRIYCFTDRRQIDNHYGYALHMEESSELYWHYITLKEKVLDRHPELVVISNLESQRTLSYTEYLDLLSDHLKRRFGYGQKDIIRVLEAYGVLIPVYHVMNFQVSETARIIHEMQVKKDIEDGGPYE